MNVPGNRIYITRSIEGDGVFDARELGQQTFHDRGATAIRDRLAKAAGLKPGQPSVLPMPKSQPRQKRRRLYVPVDEYGATSRFAIIDRTTGVVMARCYGSAFHVAQEAVLLCRSQGVSDSEFILKPC